jgi:HK97 family phage portal protein
VSSLLTTIRAYQRQLLAARKSALYDLHPELRDRVQVYSSFADRITAESDDYAGNARTFTRYVWVRKAVTLIAQTIAPLPVRVLDSQGKAITGHPLTVLYANPNDTMPGPEFRGISLVHLLLGGERFSEIVDDERGRPRELWPRRPDKVGIRPDETRKGYPAPAEYVLQDLVYPGYDGTVPAEAVVHEKFTNPLNDWRGLSPVSAVLQGIQIALLAQAQRKLFYRNNARVEYALVAAEALAPNERERLEAQVAEKYGGGQGTGLPMILEFGQDIKTISYPPKDMRTLEDQQLTADEVAAIFGVPDILMGFGNDTYDTQEKRDAAMSVLWALTLLPLVQQHDQTETHFWSTVRPLLRAGERVATDLSSVAVLQDDIGPKLENAGKLWSFGVPFNLIDKQLRLGIGPIPGGDIGYLPMNLVPADQVALPDPEPAPPPVQAAGRGIEKGRRPAVRIGAALQRIRLQLAKQMQKAVDQYFADLAERIIARARAAEKSAATVTKLPTVADLLLRTDQDALRELFTSYTLEICRASWGTWNDALGVELAFEQTDPAVVAALSQSGQRVAQITEVTRSAIVAVLEFGAQEGWTIEQLIDGVGDNAGLRDVVEETYRGRARTIARTELGTAQGVATTARYQSAGVTQVVIFDGGGDDSDDECNQLNGTVQTLNWYRQNLLGHPNCTRAAGAYYP